MVLISDAQARGSTIISPENIATLPLYKGAGQTDLTCGRCGAVLLAGIDGNIGKICVVCPACHALNEAKANDQPARAAIGTRLVEVRGFWRLVDACIGTSECRRARPRRSRPRSTR